MHFARQRMTVTWRFAVIALTIAASLVVSPKPRAQDYPVRPVKIVVPFPAGGTADAVPRLVGDWLSLK